MRKRRTRREDSDEARLNMCGQRGEDGRTWVSLSMVLSRAALEARVRAVARSWERES